MMDSVIGQFEATDYSKSEVKPTDYKPLDYLYQIWTLQSRLPNKPHSYPDRNKNVRLSQNWCYAEYGSFTCDQWC